MPSSTWLLLVLCGAPIQASSSPPATEADVRAAFEAGELGRALELAGTLPEAALGAEWRFHVLYHGGDLTGALLAAEAGLAAAPDHPRLLENAARCALALGLGERAAAHVARWLATPALAEAERDRAHDLAAQASALSEREQQLRAGAARARAVTLALAGVLAAAFWLAGLRSSGSGRYS